MDAGRRGFLRGRFAAPSPAPAQRPPWARPEAEFIARCTRCDGCLTHCPTHIIVPRDGRYPGVDFSRGECTFCGECVRHCPSGALQQAEGAVPWSLKARIGGDCLAYQGVECRVCGEACDARALRFQPALGRPAQPEIDLARCTGCGACLAPCPVQVILLENGEI